MEFILVCEIISKLGKCSQDCDLFINVSSFVASKYSKKLY